MRITGVVDSEGITGVGMSNEASIRQASYCRGYKKAVEIFILEIDQAFMRIRQEVPYPNMDVFARKIEMEFKAVVDKMKKVVTEYCGGWEEMWLPAHQPEQGNKNFLM